MILFDIIEKIKDFSIISIIPQKILQKVLTDEYIFNYNNIIVE